MRANVKEVSCLGCPGKWSLQLSVAFTSAYLLIGFFYPRVPSPVHLVSLCLNFSLLT